jgi:3'(2'), 5'-bisphosphate nucleotidase
MYERELMAALAAVGTASRLLVDEYARFQAIPDAPADITTDADGKAQEIILQHLLKAFPGDALCAEEDTPTIKNAPTSGDRIWIVDPIDGTRGFAQKNGEFSIMVAFVEKGQIGLGIVAQPAAQRLTWATRRGGCWRRDGVGTEPMRCHVSQLGALEQATLIQSRSRDPNEPSRWVIALRPGKVVESHSAGIKLAQVARGEADLYLNTYDAFHDWDICAGHILVTEAGGIVTGIRGQTLVYGLPDAWQRYGLLATNGSLHAESIRRLGSAQGV